MTNRRTINSPGFWAGKMTDEPDVRTRRDGFKFSYDPKHIVCDKVRAFEELVKGNLKGNIERAEELLPYIKQLVISNDKEVTRDMKIAAWALTRYFIKTRNETELKGLKGIVREELKPIVMQVIAQNIADLLPAVGLRTARLLKGSVGIAPKHPRIKEEG